VFVLRRGHAIVAGDELAKKSSLARLARLASEELRIVFEDGVAAYPPGAPHQVSLASWARTHLEQQLDGALAEAMVQKLAGVRIALRPELAPDAVDEADRRMLVAMAIPRRLDQIWPLARTPRFRLLAFIHFLRAVDAVELVGVASESYEAAPLPRIDVHRQAALRVLGIHEGADVDTVKRAYRRLARTLHPDLQPGVEGDRKRLLERRFAEVTAAYETLL
jgi:DnaJ-domain-containing protein 1